VFLRREIHFLRFKKIRKRFFLFFVLELENDQLYGSFLHFMGPQNLGVFLKIVFVRLLKALEREYFDDLRKGT